MFVIKNKALLTNILLYTIFYLFIFFFFYSMKVLKNINIFNNIL